MLNLTTWLEGESGTAYCASATWNHTETLDEIRFFSLYSGLLEGLQKQETARRP